MRWRELLDTYADAMDRITGALTEDPLPSPECTKPETPQIKAVPLPSIRAELPPCAPFPEHELHEYRGVCFQCSGNTKAVLLHLLSDHDCLIPPIRRYAQETTMTTPAFEPYDELDQEAHNYLTGAPAPTARSLVAILNDDRLRAHRERTDAQLAFAAAKAERKVRTEYMDDDTHLLKVWEKAVLDGARALAAGEPGCHLIETGGTADGGGHQRIIVDTETGERERLEAEWQRREAKLAAEPETGSAAWLRDLADRLQQYGELIGMVDPEDFTTKPRAIRAYADKTERQAAADTRDRECVEPILAARWAKDRDRQFLPSLVPTWADLTDEERAHCIDYGLELYRAGREDTVAAWQPGNGGGSGNPGTRGGQPAGQGGAHHA